jgi:hypothetical protein
MFQIGEHIGKSLCAPCGPSIICDEYQLVGIKADYWAN